MDESEGDRSQPVEGHAEAGRPDDRAVAPPAVAPWMSRWVRLAGGVIAAVLVAAGGFVALGPERGGGGTSLETAPPAFLSGNPGSTAAQEEACPAGATPKLGRLSRECAVELARTRLGDAGALISVRSGRYGDFLAAGWPQDVAWNRQVWAVEFVGPPICVQPPPGPGYSIAPCISYGRGALTVVLDFDTGEFIFSGAAY